MGKEELINKAELLLLKGIKVILALLILFCTLTILPMHFAAPFFRFCFYLMCIWFIFSKNLSLYEMSWKRVLGAR